MIARPGPFSATEPFDVEINIARPVPNLSVVGDALLCSGQTKTYTLNGSSSGDQIDWSTPLGGSGSGTQFNATFNGNNGSSFVTANVTTANGCGTFSVSNSVWAGTPGFQQMTYGTQGNGQTNTVYTVNSVSAGTWYVIRTNTDNAQVNSGPSWSTNVSVNGFVSAVGEYRLNLSFGQSVNITVSGSNPCGSADRTFTFTTSSGGWRLVSANPATDVVMVEFDSPDKLETLPDQIDLFSEQLTGLRR